MTKRILVVDDETNIRRVTRLTLEAAGYTVGEAGDGAAGLELFGDGAEWDLVLLDQKMPGLDGLETFRRIKERDAAARVVMVTAFASVELAVDAMKLGARDFVRKPMTPSILRAAVEAALAAPPPGRGDAPAPSAEPLIATVTMNGFTIIRPQYVGDLTAGSSHSRRFIVRSRGGSENEVSVEVPAAAVTFTERMTGRRLPAQNSFWTLLAERTLSNYLWNHGRMPPGNLQVREPDSEYLLMARRWKDD